MGTLSLRLNYLLGATVVVAASSATAAPAGAPSAAPAKPYAGLGATSVDAATIAKFAPQPLPFAVSSRIQRALDLRGAGGGAITSDGKHAFFNWRVTGNSQVWRQDGPMQFPVQVSGGEENTSLAALSPDDSFIVIMRDHSGTENTALYEQAVTGGPLIEIFASDNVQASISFIPDDASAVYYWANDRVPDSYAMYRWDLKTHARTAVFTEPGLWHSIDRMGDHLLLGKELGNAQDEIYEYDLGTHALTQLFGHNEVEEYDVRYGSTSDQFLVRTNKLGDFTRVYSSTRNAPNDLTPITPDIPHDVMGFAIDQHRTRIYYIVNDGGYRRASVLDARTHKPIAMPPLPKGDHTTLVSLTKDGRFAEFAVESSQSPSHVFTYDWKTHKLVSWRMPSVPETDLASFAPATLESYPARDGTAIPMWVRRPTSCINKLCPVVVQFHGGPESQAWPLFNPGAQLYVDAGFIFVEPNVRGSSGYGKKWLHADDGPLRSKVVTDIEDCAIAIKKKWAVGGVAPKVGVYGRSYGGYSSLMAMTFFAGAFDVGVAEVGISNLLSFLQNTSPYRRILRTSEYGDPIKDHDALLALSPITYVDRTKAPLLLMQGVNDPRVPVGEALQIHAALEKRGVPGGLILFADEGHGNSKRSNQVLSIGHTIEFFEKYLKN